MPGKPPSERGPSSGKPSRMDYVFRAGFVFLIALSFVGMLFGIVKQVNQCPMGYTLVTPLFSKPFCGLAPKE